MTTATARKATPVILSAPKLETAWKNLCTVTSKNDGLARQAITRLAKEVKASKLSIRDAQKVIRETNLESSLVKVSHIEGLPTWLELQKFGTFTALDLDRQLSSAVGAYKLLGSGNAEKLESFEAVAKATAEARKVKNNKAKGSTPKADTGVKVKKTTSLTETLKAISLMIESLDASEIEDSHIEQFNEIQAIFEHKVMQDA